MLAGIVDTLETNFLWLGQKANTEPPQPQIMQGTIDAFWIKTYWLLCNYFWKNKMSDLRGRYHGNICVFKMIL
ncbi:hypothetical protein [Flexibacter flexilis]|uniref:hypothetical protein n=1 Tax=Flexibacter flexilis TaxID=998 RepID=UPI0015A57275|nr:hypothetical protein [Flexibacter flexilis]